MEAQMIKYPNCLLMG